MVRTNHGVPITLRAKKEGITPQDVVDRYHGIIKKSFEEFGITFDIYSRTTSATHHQMASDFFRTLYDKGEFIEKTSEQYYDEEAKQFLADPVISRVLVRVVETRRRMAISARLAVRLLADGFGRSEIRYQWQQAGDA